MMYSFHILTIWAYLAYKIELIWLTLTFKNSSFVAFLQRVYDNCFTFSSSGKALLKRGFDVCISKIETSSKERQRLRCLLIHIVYKLEGDKQGFILVYFSCKLVFSNQKCPVKVLLSASNVYIMNF